MNETEYKKDITNIRHWSINYCKLQYYHINHSFIIQHELHLLKVSLSHHCYFVFFFHVSTLSEPIKAANLTLQRSLTSMGRYVFFLISTLSETYKANLNLQRFLTIMGRYVSFQKSLVVIPIKQILRLTTF